jgi:hypothetical protein
METEELKNIWKAYDNRLEKLLTINVKYIESMQSQKMHSAFRSLMMRKIADLVWGVLSAGIFGFFIFAHYNQLHFLISGGILMLFSVLLIVTCIEQMQIISEMKYTRQVTKMQQKLALFQSFWARYSRLSVLMFPLFIASMIVFFQMIFGIDLVAIADKGYWISNLIVSLLFIPPAIWYYRKMSIRNMHIPWVRKIIESGGGKSAVEAIEFLKEIEDFRKTDAK